MKNTKLSAKEYEQKGQKKWPLFNVNTYSLLGLSVARWFKEKLLNFTLLAKRCLIWCRNAL